MALFVRPLALALATLAPFVACGDKPADTTPTSGPDSGVPDAAPPAADSSQPSPDANTPRDAASTDASSTDASSDASAAAVLNPDWLPESTVVAQPIPTKADFYVATTGSDSNPGTASQPFKTVQKGVSASFPGATILVHAGTYNEQVVFAAANSGAAGKYITLAAYPGETPVIDGTGITIANGGLVEVNGNYVRVSGFTVQNVAGTDFQLGIYVRNASHVVFDNNHTIHTASAGIGAWYSSSVLIRNNRVEDGRTTGSQECLSLNGATQFEVSFNTVWNTQDWSQKCEGIDIKNGSGVGRVVGNVAHDLPYEGIYIDAYEDGVHDVDVYANLTYNCSMGIALTSEVKGTLENVKIYDNVVHDTGYIGIGFPAWSGSTNQGTITNVSVFNNTIDNRNAQYTVNPTGLYFAYPSLGTITVKNNIIATNGTAFVFESASTVSTLDVGHNLVSAPQVSSGRNGFADPSMISGDPRFVGNGDYHLAAGSPAIDQADDTIAPAYDFDGSRRPQGKAADIGAFEFGP